RGLVDMIRELDADVPRKMTAVELTNIASQPERSIVTPSKLSNTSGVVGRALADAAVLIESQGAVSAIDRLHTALNGHLRGICNDAGIDFASDASAAKLMKLLRENH